LKHFTSLSVFWSREAVINQKKNVKELRDKAAKYRVIARQAPDPETAKRILELTEELEQQARDMERGK
jgi:hypothetical protein